MDATFLFCFFTHLIFFICVEAQCDGATVNLTVEHLPFR